MASAGQVNHVFVVVCLVLCVLFYRVSGSSRCGCGLGAVFPPYLSFLLVGRAGIGVWDWEHLVFSAFSAGVLFFSRRGSSGLLKRRVMLDEGVTPTLAPCLLVVVAIIGAGDGGGVVLV